MRDGAGKTPVAAVYGAGKGIRGQMSIYLPVAEVSVGVFLLLGMGGGVGFLTGLLGVGGGFLMTPLLILIGIPPSVAVACGANQMVASSFSGVLTHWRRKTVDFRMGGVLLAGGLIGAVAGVRLFAFLRTLGQVELLVSLCYVVVLGIVGGLMMWESIGALMRSKRPGEAKPQRLHKKGTWIRKLPFRMRFHQSKLYISVIPPLLIGLFVGVLSALMGIGGGFIVVPAMIYILGMATTVVMGTSLFQIIFVTGAATMMHAVYNHTVDGILVMMLVVGGVIGTQIGARVGHLIKAEWLRIILATVVVAICVKFGVDLVRPPDELFNIAEGTG